MYIEKLNTYHYGYNATKGGDGSILFDYDKIIEIYKQGGTITECAAKIGLCMKGKSKTAYKFIWK